MGSRLNIGIYIGPNDLDIAAWLNMLQENGLSRATWIRGLICAHSLGRPLMIGCISTNPPEPTKPEPKPANGQLLFGVGDSQAARKERYSYGWQVRGPNREFIVGSIANVSHSGRGLGKRSRRCHLREVPDSPEPGLRQHSRSALCR